MGAVSYLQHSKYGSMSSVRINNYSEYKTGYANVLEPTCGYTGKNVINMEIQKISQNLGIQVLEIWEVPPEILRESMT